MSKGKGRRTRRPNLQDRRTRAVLTEKYIATLDPGAAQGPVMPDKKKATKAQAGGAPEEAGPSGQGANNGWEAKHWSACKTESLDDTKAFYSLFTAAGFSISEKMEEFKELTKAAFVNEAVASTDFADLRREFAYQGLNLALIINIFIGLGQLAHGSGAAGRTNIGIDLMQLMVFFVLRGTNISGAVGKKQGTLDTAKEKLMVLAKRYHIVSPKHRNNHADLLNGKPSAESITLGRLAAAFPLWAAKAAYSVLDGTPEEKCRKFARTPHAWLVFNMIPELNELALEARVAQAKKIATKEKPYSLPDVIQYSSMTMPIRESELLEFLEFCKWPEKALPIGSGYFKVSDKAFVLFDRIDNDDIAEACGKYISDHEWPDEEVESESDDSKES